MIKKSLGQHFLTDPRILARIVDALEPLPDDQVVEIGAGSGTLTRALAPRVGRVVAIEKDRSLAEQCKLMNAEHRITNVEVVTGDVLRLDSQLFRHSTFDIRHSKFVGNIPYYITTPIIELALRERPALIVLLVQDEVADRIVSAPGSKVYGGLSVGAQVEAHVEKVFTVKAGSFTPPPKVHSAVIRLRPRERPLVAAQDVPAFRAFVAACFSLRRKTLRNVLRALTGRPADVVDEALAQLGLDPRVRAETLAPERFVALWRWSHERPDLRREGGL
ncbi:MAG TPA: 16S rRNA (adenine(1518)-N(6)/adenine(1519)-N(6))-dimethyltransferase RsmA [Gemmatimonadales bacterium]|nr:16S rRNA (adenine(1518)-N(6)/adenine(1519)-N(6))-dimethyltransferase RsmA [Gemmatimonadales bacterium]